MSQTTKYKNLVLELFAKIPSLKNYCLHVILDIVCIAHDAGVDSIILSCIKNDSANLAFQKKDTL